RSQPPPELVMRLSQGWGDFCWLRDSLPLLDTHLTRLLAMHPDAGAERTRGPRGSRTYTGLLGLQESVQRVLALQEFCTNGGGATEPPEIDDE
ncbi:MAG TPA: hypothetical protein VD866_30930, partial [Urbifossiella sp.]|nr:hypothetical protein [Urbifossiella sp.]